MYFSTVNSTNFNLYFHITHRIPRFKALHLMVWIYFVSVNVSERNMFSHVKQLSLKICGFSIIEMICYHGNMLTAECLF